MQMMRRSALRGSGRRPYPTGGARHTGEDHAPALRIVVYTEAVSRGGAEVSLRNLLAALDPSLDVTVMGVDGDVCGWVAAARPGTAVVVVPPVRNKVSFTAFLAHRRALARLRPNVFHANLRRMDDAQYALLAALTVPGVRAVAVEQLPLPPSTRASRLLKRLTAPGLAAHVAVGRRAAHLVEEAIGLRPGSVATVYNGVPDVELPEARRGRAPVIGTLARLDRIKGLDVLLEAVAGLAEATLLIAGDGPERGALEAQAERLGLDGRTRFVTWSDDARRLLGAMDVFVLPSRNEGFPLSIVEAMLAALPVVATSVGSVAEAVVEGETGLIVPPDDADALRDALARLLGSHDLRRRMGQAGRARALEHFTAGAMAREFEALYRRVVGPRTGPGQPG